MSDQNMHTVFKAGKHNSDGFRNTCSHQHITGVRDETSILQSEVSLVSDSVQKIEKSQNEMSNRLEQMETL